MGHLITQACLENQRNAAAWYARARLWLDAVDAENHLSFGGWARQFATQDQATAARLSRADRLLRGLEG